MDRDDIRKSRSIGALRSGVHSPDDNVEREHPKPKPKSSVIEELQNMEHGFDFSTMGTMGDFSGWGFGNVDEGKEEEEETKSWGNNRGGRRDRDQGGRRDGGGGGGSSRGGRDGGGRYQGGRGNFEGKGGKREYSYYDNDDGEGGGWNQRGRAGGKDQNRSNDKPRKPEDWICSECNFENFSARTSCLKCSAEKDQRKSGFGVRGVPKSASRANASFPERHGDKEDEDPEGDDESQMEPPKRPKLDPSVYGPPTVTSWADIREYDDDHDAQKFAEENAYLARRYGEGTVRVRYAHNGVVGYHCMICDVEMTGEKPLDLHCKSMKHLKKKERKENPHLFEEPQEHRQTKEKKLGKPKLLPPEAFASDGNQGNQGGRGHDMGQNRESYGGGRNQGPRGGMNRNNSQGGDYGDWRDPGPSRIGDKGGSGMSSSSGGGGLTGGPTGTLLSKLADCSVKCEGDAELATNVISLLLKSLKSYSVKKGESKIAELLLQAELKISTIKALKVGLQYLSGSGNMGGAKSGGGMGGDMGGPMRGSMGGPVGGSMGRPMGGGMYDDYRR